MDIKSIRQEIDKINSQDTCSRDEIQQLCKNFQEIECNVALFWVPRVGKTRGALNCLKKGRHLICSNTTLIRENWKEEVKKFESDLGEVISICYDSLHKIEGEFDTIILDEADLLSENYAELVRNINHKRIIFLTGTVTMRLREQLETLNSLPIVRWVIGFQKAIDWGILPKPKIVLLKLKLSTEGRKNLYEKSSNKAKKNLILTYPAYFSLKTWERYEKAKKNNIHIQCTEFEYNRMLSEDLDYWKSIHEDEESPVPKSVTLNKIKRLGLNRKNFYAAKKLQYVNRIVKRFGLESKRLLIFANSIEQAEMLDFKDQGYHVIHSKNANEAALERFNNMETAKIIAVGMLDRGIAITNIDASIILQVSSSDASTTQKASRNLLDDSPFLILPYFAGTKDEDWVKKFVSKFNEEYIEEVDVTNYIK